MRMSVQAAVAAGAAGMTVWVAAPWVAMARHGTVMDQAVERWDRVGPPPALARVLPFRRFSLRRRRPAPGGLDAPAA